MSGGNRLSEKMVMASLQSGAITEDQIELYRYSFSSLLGYAASFGTMFLLALLLREFLGTIVYILFFYPLRIYAGGFHEKTPLRCYIKSTVLFGLTLIAAKAAHLLPLPLLIALVVASSLAIFWKAPVESANNPLSTELKKRYRKIALMVLAVELVTFFIIERLSNSTVIYFASAAIITEAALVIIPFHDGDEADKQTGLAQPQIHN